MLTQWLRSVVYLLHKSTQHVKVKVNGEERICNLIANTEEHKDVNGRW